MSSDAAGYVAAEVDDEKEFEKAPISRSHLAVVLVGLVTLGCFNFLLLKVTYTAYTDKYGFFVNQGINFLYIVFGVLAFYPRDFLTDDITPEMWKFPHKVTLCNNPLLIFSIADIRA